MQAKSDENFIFKKEEEGYIWENCEVKVVFSHCSFQAFNEYTFVNSVAEIMYLYYSVDLFQNVPFYGEMYDKEPVWQWEKVSHTSTYDFPAIRQLLFILDHILHQELSKEKCRKIQYGKPEDKRNGYEYIMETEDFLYDDYYEVKRTMIETDGKEDGEFFSIYLGCSIDSQGGLSSTGIKLQRLGRQDLEELLKCAKTFMEDAIKEYNEAIREKIKMDTASFIVQGNKLYGFAKDYQNKKVLNTLEHVYVVGDRFDEITELVPGEEGKFSSREHYDVEILEITEKEIVVKGYVGEKKEEEPASHILIRHLLFFSDDISGERLHFQEKEIAADFCRLLSDREKEEFRKETEENLIRRWGEAIIDRYWMCREEHQYLSHDESKDNIENANLALQNVIKIIKSEV